MAVATYRQLLAWQRAVELVEAVYRLTEDFPQRELLGLTAQVRRAAVAVRSNIAEGQGRGEGNDFARFLRIARGSVQEVETQLIVASRLGFTTSEEADRVLVLADEVGRLILGLARSVQKRGGGDR